VTQQAVEPALGKLLTGENFRERFFTNPEIATWEAVDSFTDRARGALAAVSRSGRPVQ
jgi:hypothetical protein